MANHNMQVTGQRAKEYCIQFPTVSTRELARKLVADFPGLYKDVDHARHTLRYYRGANGELARKHVGDRVIPRVPKSDITKKEAYKNYTVTRFPVAIGSDAHMPYHDKVAIEAFLEHASIIGAKTLLLNGDWMDCYQTSRWVKDPTKRSFPEEVAMMREFLTEIRNAFPDADIVYKEGNHEERYEKYLMNNAAVLFGLEELTLPSLLGLDKMHIDYVGHKRVITARKLNIIHGHEYVFSMSNPVNPARGLYLRAKKSTMVGHFHQTSEHTETAINGDIATCWSIGCLSDLHPEYMPLNKWNHGFADMVIDDENIWTVHNYRMYQGRVL